MERSSARVLSPRMEHSGTGIRPRDAVCGIALHDPAAHTHAGMAQSSDYLTMTILRTLSPAIHSHSAK